MIEYTEDGQLVMRDEEVNIEDILLSKKPFDLIQNLKKKSDDNKRG